MKKIYFISCIVINLFNLQAQNLVPNGSFETTSLCPVVVSEIYYAPPWFQPATWHGNVINSCSSDLFNTCSSDVGIPVNIQGFQNARTGIGYAGIIPYTDTFNYREYIEVPLLDSLITNHTYCVNFYVSLANLYGTAISNIGAYFSADSLLDNSYHAHAIDYVTPQIENSISNMLIDSLNWMIVSGNFTAIGGERFMTIGNFHSPSNTNSITVIPGNSYGSYYFIDDISVIDCTEVGVEEIQKPNTNFKLYPNPNNGNMVLEYDMEGETVLFNVYDVSGRLVKQKVLTSENKTTVFNAEELNAGAYYYEVKIGDKKVKSDKLIIIK